MNDEFKAMRQKVERFFKSRQTFQPAGDNWYRMEHEEGAKDAEIYIYDAIGFFGIEAESFVRELSALEADTITLRINSPGGNVFDGSAIYNALKRHKATVNVHIDGVAASMASVIALAGDTISMAENAFFMIHKPWSFVIGPADDMRKEAELLDKIEGTAVGIYQSRSDLSESEVRAAMAAETWYTAEEARDAGFIDEIDGGSEARASFDMSVFAKTPGKIQSEERDLELTERSLEAILREAGLSRTNAKQRVADFKMRCQREADEGGEFDEVAALIQRNIESMSPT